MTRHQNKIHYAHPSIGEKEIEYVEDAIRTGWGEKCHDYIYRFRDAFCEYTKAQFGIPTSSCTGALHIALKTAGIGVNDEVIAPDLTWIASVSPITYLGAKPVLVDVKPDTWCIDPIKIEKAITPNTKAIIAVHLYGNLCDMDEIMRIAKAHNLIVIEDAAEAIGSYYKGHHAGTIGHFGVFSFHGTKTITTGEGGMLVTKTESNYIRASILNDHGRNPQNQKQFWCETIGYKYRMSNLQAAVGLAQVERAHELVLRKRDIFRMYSSHLEKFQEIIMNPEASDTVNSYWMPTVFWNPEIKLNRDKLISAFKTQNIDCRVVFYPVSMFPEFESIPDNTNAYSLYYRGINLPSYFDITDEEVATVCDMLTKSIIASATC